MKFAETAPIDLAKSCASSVARPHSALAQGQM